MELKGSATEQNLKDAFAGESQANRRYLYFSFGTMSMCMPLCWNTLTKSSPTSGLL